MGAKNIPPKFTEKLDLNAKFSHVDYTLSDVYDVCEKLALAGVLKAGGRLETDDDGEEVLLIPVQTPKLSKLMKSYDPEPSANSRFSDEEMSRIKTP